MRAGDLAASSVTNAEVLPIDHVGTAREIHDVVSGLQEKVGSHLDLAPALAEAKRFLGAAERLDGAKARVRERAEARRINEVLMRLSRVLNPVIYSQSGRFHHDPAEWSPIMRATSSQVLAGFGKAAGLGKLAGQPEYGFLRAESVRERNRVVTALREATRLVEETLDGQ